MYLYLLSARGCAYEYNKKNKHLVSGTEQICNRKNAYVKIVFIAYGGVFDL